MNEIKNELSPEEKPDEKLMSESDNEDSSEGESRSRFQEYFNDHKEDNIPKMTEILLTFYNLKNIDEELTEIDDEKGDLPEKIDSLNEKIKIIEKELMEKNISTAKLENEKAKLEEDDKSFEDRINKYDEQKYNVRSNDEYDDIVKTIESLFEEVKKNEQRIKDINGIHASLTADIESLESKIKELTDELNEKQTLLDELDEQYEQDESVLREKRIALLAKLDERSKNLYERINNSYKGEATAIVRKGNCSGCYNSIPPQRVIEIKTAEKIFNCQSCGRILISDEMLSARDN